MVEWSPGHQGRHQLVDSSSPRRTVANLLEKFLVANIVVKIAPLSFRLALNFFKQSTVSCRCRVDATRSRW